MKPIVLAVLATTLLFTSVSVEAEPKIVIRSAGPLPIYGSIQTATTGPAYLVVSGSVFSQTQNRKIGIAVFVDDLIVGTAEIYSNAPNTHRAVITQYIPIDLDKPWPEETVPPTYQFVLRAMNGDTLSDSNDSYSLIILIE